MCLIIDACTFHAVFNRDDENHSKYKPVLDWITNKRGKMIIGGKKYHEELVGASYLRILAELDRQRRLVKLPDNDVNRLASRLKRQVNHRDFDDEHLVAMVTVSKCRVVCTNDDRAIPFLQRRDLYPHYFKLPKVYKTVRNAGLCCHENVVGACVEEVR
jgi:predicted nucleic acid-binding protein